MSTLTPNYGLIVPEATDTVAQVRADYATNLGLIDNISGGGGGGGGNVYGAFINTNRIIASGVWNGSFSYLATEDCFVFLDGDLQNSHFIVYIDGVKIYDIGSSAYVEQMKLFPVRKGQTMTATRTTAYDLNYIVYGLIQGTESIFTPIIYSDNERMVGIWRDNKPLYQKSFSFTANVGSNQYVTIDTLTGYGDIISFDGWFKESNIYYGLNDIGARLKVEANGELRFAAASNSSWYGSGYVTIQYTKSADVAGSGNWNTDGIPMVHYSTTEQVIGTYLGQTLYQKTFVLPSSINVSYTSWENMGVSVTNGEKVVGCFGIATDGTHSQLMAYFDSDVVKCQSARNGNPSYNVQEITIQYTKSS